MSPCNYVFEDGLPIALIDFDNAFIGSRATDVGIFAWCWINIDGEHALAEIVKNLRAFLVGYSTLKSTELLDAIMTVQSQAVARSKKELSLREQDWHAGLAWQEKCYQWMIQHEAEIRSALG